MVSTEQQTVQQLAKFAAQWFETAERGLPPVYAAVLNFLAERADG